MKRTTAKLIRELQASVADLVTAAPETAEALGILLNHYTAAGAGVVVKGRKSTGTKTPRGRKVVDEVEDDDDLDDGFDEDEAEDEDGDDLEGFDDLDELEDGDEDEDEAPAPKRRTRKKTSKTTTTRTRRSRKTAPEPVEEDEAEEVSISMDEVTEDEVWGLLEGEASEVAVSATYAKMKITALKRELKGLGFEDLSEIEGEGTRGERVENLRTFLSGIEAVVNAIAEHGIDAISEAYEDLTDEPLKVRGRGKAKIANAAKAYFEAVMSADEEEE